jgi:hypothetical protein
VKYIRQCAAPGCEETFETNRKDRLYHDASCRCRVMNNRAAERIRQAAVAEVQAQYGTATLAVPKINKVTVPEMTTVAGLNPTQPLSTNTKKLFDYLKEKSPLEVV